MTNNNRRRDNQGQFTQKSDEPRQLHSIRLTDSAWEELGEIADSKEITRADLIEEVVKSGKLKKILSPKSETYRKRIEKTIEKVLKDPDVTRQGKDVGAIKRAFNAFLKEI